MSNPNTLQAVVNRHPNADALGPLVANDTYRRAVDAELALREDASNKAAALASKTEELSGVVSMFASAVALVKLIAVKFPEAEPYIVEAIKQIQLAMAVIKDNPVPPVPAPGPTPALVNRRVGAPDTRPLPQIERRHGAPDTRVASTRAASAPPAPPAPGARE